MLTVRVPERDRNKCERVTGPQPERVGSIFAGVNATRTSGTGPERDRNANRIRCEHGLIYRPKQLIFDVPVQDVMITTLSCFLHYRSEYQSGFACPWEGDKRPGG